MVKSALELAGAFKQIETDAMLSLCSFGAPVNAEAAADLKERLSAWRGLVVSCLVQAGQDATAEERKDISAALILINTIS